MATADTVVIYDSDWNPHNDIQVGVIMIYRCVLKLYTGGCYNDIQMRVKVIHRWVL